MTSSKPPQLGPSSIGDAQSTEASLRAELEIGLADLAAGRLKNVDAEAIKTAGLNMLHQLQQDIQAGLDSGPAGALDLETIKARGRKHLAAGHR